MKENFLTMLVVVALTFCTSGRAAEILPAGGTNQNMLPPAATGLAEPAGRALFLKNCAHCHGADAHGDDGPDLHALDWTDEQIAKRIRNGKKGQMTAFAGKLTGEQIAGLIAYLRTLK